MNEALEQRKLAEQLVETFASALTSMKDPAAEGHAAVDYIPEKELITTIEVNQTENGIDCATLGEATISKTLCGPYFLQCANGKLFRKTCPKGLMFDAERNYCEYPQGVKGCEDVKRVSPKTSTPTYLSDEKKKESFECKNKEDGFYGMGNCLKTFASCREGHLRIIECNSGLVYDARKNACNYPDACNANRASEVLPQLFTRAGAIEKADQTEVEMKPAKPEIDCAFEGMEASKQLCEPDYWRCNSGKPVRKTCPEGLVFDNQYNWCDYPEKVQECQKVNGISEVSTTANLEKAVEQPTAVEQSVEATTLTPKPPAPTYSMDFDCRNRSDGFYDMGFCHTSYVYCSGGEPRIINCDFGLFYDESVNACGYPEECED